MKLAVTNIIKKVKILPAFEIRNNGEQEEKPKQSYLEKTKKRKPNTKNQTTFFYSSSI